MLFLGPVRAPSRPKLFLPSRHGAERVLHRDVTGIAMSVLAVSSASAFPQGWESPSRTPSRLRRAGAVPGPRAFPARSHLCLGGPARVSRLGQAAIPALVVGMKIPGTNPTF